MNWVALVFALELGISPQVGVVLYDPLALAVREWQVGYVEMDAEAIIFSHAFAGGSVRTYVIPDGWANFWPAEAVYDFRLGLRWAPLELGWRHRCFHPVMPYQPIVQQVMTGFEGGYDELYLRLSGRYGR